MVFSTLEDETSPANILVWKDLFEANRRLVMTASLLVVRGKLQHAEGVTHLVAQGFEDLSDRLVDLKYEGPAPKSAHASADA